MTAHQRAVAVLMKHGPMRTQDFAVIMWPTAWRHCENKIRFCTETGYFLAKMERRGLIRKNGSREYYVRKEDHD